MWYCRVNAEDVLWEWITSSPKIGKCCVREHSLPAQGVGRLFKKIRVVVIWWMDQRLESDKYPAFSINKASRLLPSKSRFCLSFTFSAWSLLLISWRKSSLTWFNSVLAIHDVTLNVSRQMIFLFLCCLEINLTPDYISRRHIKTTTTDESRTITNHISQQMASWQKGLRKVHIRLYLHEWMHASRYGR